MPEPIVTLNEEPLKTDLRELARRTVEDTLNGLLEEETGDLVDAERYERTAEREACRAGHYDRSLTTSSGEVTIRMPKLKVLCAMTLFTPTTRDMGGRRVELPEPVAAAVVGHHALDADARRGEEGQAARHEGGAGGAPLVVEELDVRGAAVVVDRHVQAAPAGAGAPRRRGGVGPPAPAVGHPRHPLDVDVDELAGPPALVAHWRGGPPPADPAGHAVDVREARQPGARHDPGAGAGRHAGLGRERERGEQHGAPGLEDPLLVPGRGQPGEPAGPARAVGHRLAAAGAGEPLARGLPAHPHLARDGRDALAPGDPGDERLPAPGREPCVRML